MTNRERYYHYPYGKPSKTDYSGFKGIIPTIRDFKPDDWTSVKVSQITWDDINNMVNETSRIKHDRYTV